MSLRSFFKRQAPEAAPAAAAPEDDLAVQAARAQARRRLIGAVVLLAIGVVVFPLAFDGKPRALPGDVRIELQRGEGTVSVMPAPVPAATRQGTPAALAEPVAEPAAPASEPAAGSAGGSAASAAPAPASAANAVARPAAAAPVAASAQAASGPSRKAAEAARPEARAASAPTGATTSASAVPAQGGRFVVQVGAFTDAVALREARQKVEKLGLKTYTQVIENDAGKRTRVRVGPFETRAEAEAAGARIKAAGLPAYLLTL